MQRISVIFYKGHWTRYEHVCKVSHFCHVHGFLNNLNKIWLLGNLYKEIM
jgi:hypothetical protein